MTRVPNQRRSEQIISFKKYKLGYLFYCRRNNHNFFESRTKNHIFFEIL